MAHGTRLLPTNRSVTINQPLDFNTIRDLIQDLYRARDFETALALASENAAAFPEHAPIFYYWRMNFAAHLGDTDLTLAIFREFLARGEWFGEMLLRGNPAFVDLQGAPDFEALVQRNTELAERDLNQDYPLLNIRPRERCDRPERACPLLLVLHDNGSNPAQALPFWQPAAQVGWLVSASRSSQAMWKSAYVWDNREIAANEIRAHIGTLQERYSIAAESIVIAGNGTGAEMAIYYALAHSDTVAGFIAVDPAGPFSETPSNWGPLIERSAADNDITSLVGALLQSEGEPSVPLENMLEFQEMLARAGVQCSLAEVRDATPDQPEAYIEAIVEALAAID